MDAGPKVEPHKSLYVSLVTVHSIVSISILHKPTIIDYIRNKLVSILHYLNTNNTHIKKSPTFTSITACVEKGAACCMYLCNSSRHHQGSAQPM